MALLCPYVVAKAAVSGGHVDVGRRARLVRDAGSFMVHTLYDFTRARGNEVTFNTFDDRGHGFPTIPL